MSSLSFARTLQKYHKINLDSFILVHLLKDQIQITLFWRVEQHSLGKKKMNQYGNFSKR